MRSRRSLRLLVPVAVLGVLAPVVLLLEGTPAQADQVDATCTDSAGDAQTIQSAIDSSSEGDEVVFRGPCRVNRTIVLRGGRSYRGESTRTVIQAAAGSNLDAVLASDAWVQDVDHTGEPISLRDLVVDANGAENPDGGDGVVIRSWSTQVEDLTIGETRGNGLVIAGSSRAGTPIRQGHTQVQGTISGVYVTDAGENGVLVQDAGNSVTDWHLLDNWVGSTGGDGIHLENSAGWQVAGNHLYDVEGSGIEAERMFASSVTDNYVEDYGLGANAIRLTVQSGAVGSTVRGNRVFQGNPSGGTTLIKVLGVISGTGVLSVTDNVVHGRGGPGIGLDYRDGDGELKVSSSGNNVTGVTTKRRGVTPIATY